MRFADGVRAWITLPWEKHVLRALAVLAMVGFLVLLLDEGRAYPVLLLPILAFALLSVLSPDSEAPLITLGGAVLLWGSGMRAEHVTSPVTLLAALLLLAFHVCLTVTAHGPGPARLARATMLRWGLRTGVIALVTTGAWLAVRGLSASPLHAPSWGRGLALVLISLGVVGALGVLTGNRRRRDPQR